MKTLIIAEKPSQAREYANTLGNFAKKDGYFENEKYFLTWCFGHLIELETDDKYRTEGYWNKDYLPIIPEKYQFCIGKKGKATDSGKKAQVNLIKSLMDKSESIINATDADREGELIFLYVYRFLKCKLPYRRLWISSLTENDIKKGFKNLLSADEIKNLGKAGYARAIADWLVGINGTQAATLQLGNGKLLTIGRVQTAILKIICERFLKNKNFQKTFTYKIRALHTFSNDKFFSETETFEKKEDAQKLVKTLFVEHICTEREEKLQKVAPPLLHSIDSLIVEANRKFGYTGQQTLDCAQSLYEKKLTSYPRTDSQYINEENFANLKTFLPKLLNEILNLDYIFEVEKPKSVNAKKLTGSHDAIVPTGVTTAYSTLNEKEKNVYHLVLHKCLESFSVPAEYKKLKLVFDNNKTNFYTRTSKLLKAGWKIFSFSNLNKEENENEEEQNLDLPFEKGDKIKVENFEIKEIESKPPALYSEATLTPDLTNIEKFLKEENPELYEDLNQKIDLKDVQIGTQATRPGIIERLKHLQFIEVKNNKFIPTETGLSYYETIKNLVVSNIANTAILEKKLKDVADGVKPEREFYSEINDYTRKIVSDIFSINIQETSFATPKSSGICLCPKCKKGEIKEGNKAFYCAEYKNGCDFSVGKIILEKRISQANCKDLCEKKQTKLIKSFAGKKGNFDAKLKLNEECKIEFEFIK